MYCFFSVLASSSRSYRVRIIQVYFVYLVAVHFLMLHFVITSIKPFRSDSYGQPVNSVPVSGILGGPGSINTSNALLGPSYSQLANQTPPWQGRQVEVISAILRRIFLSKFTNIIF